MNVTYACPHCEQAVRLPFDAETRELECPHCSRALYLPAAAVEEGQLNRCLICPSNDLFIRKDFPQRLGVGLVAVGILFSSVAWAYHQVTLTFAVLFATALIDVVLYLVVGDALMCYRCHAEYRGLHGMDGHEAFDLETHERYRQLNARLDQQHKVV